MKKSIPRSALSQSGDAFLIINYELFIVSEDPPTPKWGLRHILRYLI